MSRAKNQHSVPQFLLRNFTDADGLVHVFDKVSERFYATNPRNAAVEARFYDFHDDEGIGRSAEPFFTRMESDIASIIDGIIEKETIAHLTDNERVQLSLFVAVQQLRVKSNRQKILSAHEGLRKILRERGIDPGGVVPEMDEVEAKRISISTLPDAKEHSKYFYKKNWILQRAPKDKLFFMSDNPVVLHNLVERPKRGNLGLAVPFIELYMPISKDFMLGFHCDGWRQKIETALADAAALRKVGVPIPPLRYEYHYLKCLKDKTPDPLIPENVTHLNSLQVIHSSQYVYASNDDFELAKEMVTSCPELKETPEVTFS